MDVVFLDANVLFSAAYRSRAGLQRLWDLKGVELVSSAYAIEEADRNLTPEQRLRLVRLLRSTRVVPERSGLEPDPRLDESGLPPKDLPILAAAMSADATHLLTGDMTHFGPLLGTTIADVSILTPGQYLRDLLGDPGRPV